MSRARTDLRGAQHGEFAKANEIWRDLKKTYGDDVALERAKMRWAQVKANMTGSRVGGVGNLKVGAQRLEHKPADIGMDGHPKLDANTAPAFERSYRRIDRWGDRVSAAARKRQSVRSQIQAGFGTATVEPIVPLPSASPKTPRRRTAASRSGHRWRACATAGAPTDWIAADIPRPSRHARAQSEMRKIRYTTRCSATIR